MYVYIGTHGLYVPLVFGVVAVRGVGGGLGVGGGEGLANEQRSKGTSQQCSNECFWRRM